MATLNGARALGLDEEIGSLRRGKSADVVAVHLGGVESRPVYQPVSQLVYACGRQQVSDVWIAGRHLLKERRLTTLDEAAIVANAEAWREKIAAKDSHNTRGQI
jgi:5-methylthioadenosine/S-adenosylhomocysteine deaminase